MTPDPLPPIPSPPSHHWRQIRVRVLPPIAFLAVLGVTVWLWALNQATPLVFGTAEGPVADVASPQAGRLVELKVEPYQEVRAGEIIATVDPVNPEVLSNTLAVIRAEMEAIRADAGYDAGDRVRYAQYQMDWLLQRADLVELRAQHRFAESEFQRLSKLVKENVASQTDYEIAKRDLEQSKTLLDERAAAVEQTGKTLRELAPENLNTETPAVRAAIAVAEEQLRLAEAQLRPLALIAPISGRVSCVYRPAGSTVAASEPIVTIADPKVDRIVAFLGQPFGVEPRVGMEVVVRSRGHHRAVARSHITHVGPRVELFTAPLRIRGMGAAQERGLPFIVSVPTGMNLRPGELVDISLLN